MNIWKKQNEEGYKEEHIECNKVIAPLGEIKGNYLNRESVIKRITVVTQYEEIEQAARSLGVNVYHQPSSGRGESPPPENRLKSQLRR